jgi:hypothetical protein
MASLPPWRYVLAAFFASYLVLGCALVFSYARATVRCWNTFYVRVRGPSLLLTAFGVLGVGHTVRESLVPIQPHLNIL